MKAAILKILVLSFIIIGLTTITNAQEERKVNNEVFLSVNYSMTAPNLGHGLMAYGFGFHHYFFSAKKINLISGLEYNRGNFFIEKLATGHYGNMEDITYHVLRISVPLKGRVNFGNQIKLFLDLGAFLDIDLDSKMEYEKFPFPTFAEDDPNESNLYPAEMGGNYGFSLGGGSSIPIQKYRLSFLLEYKYGLKEIYEEYDPFRHHYIRLNIGFVF